MANNYSDWHKRNAEMSLEDFKRIVCISDDQLKETTAVKSRKRPKALKYWIGFTVAFVVFFTIANFGGEYLVKTLRSFKTSKDILKEEWVREAYGIYGLTVEAPVKLRKGELSIPDEVKTLIERMDVYEYKSAGGFNLMITSIRYHQAIGAVNLQGAADGSANEMKLQEGITQFDYKEDYLYKGDIPGFIQRGSFLEHGDQMEFINTGFAKDLNLWQVMVGYHTEDENGRKVAERIIESIEIKFNENPL